jgi:erythromycin esterase
VRSRALWLALLCSCGGLPDGVAPFDGTAADLPSGDLEPLWALIGDARLVGLGESVHTSGGFYAAKHRLIRVLIEERGFRVVAFETPRGRARVLDEYLLSGDCDRPPAEVLGIAIFEVFSDDNTYALMRWICERNAASPEDPVRLFGFDIQQPDEDSAEIRSFLETWAPEAAPELLAGISTCAVLYSETFPSEADHTACLAGLDALDAWSAAEEAALIASAGARTYRLFATAGVGFRAAQRHYFAHASDQSAAYEHRDRGMGAVFQAVLELDFASDARVAIWAHNVHLAMNHDRIAASLYAPRATLFGTVLAAAFGADYAPVALSAHGPGTNWPQIDLVEEHTIYGTAEGSLEHRLHELEQPYLIVDPAAPFLESDEPLLFSQERMVPSEQFRAIVYLDSSPPMNAVFW